uniref:Uncharacterized protein n=1 Tax=Labrus bergylta TaxID=56723 RepID=A0A3Q3ED13_9LABR
SLSLSLSLSLLSSQTESKAADSMLQFVSNQVGDFPDLFEDQMASAGSAQSGASTTPAPRPTPQTPRTPTPAAYQSSNSSLTPSQTLSPQSLPLTPPLTPVQTPSPTAVSSGQQVTRTPPLLHMFNPTSFVSSFKVLQPQMQSIMTSQQLQPMTIQHQRVLTSNGIQTLSTAPAAVMQNDLNTSSFNVPESVLVQQPQILKTDSLVLTTLKPDGTQVLSTMQSPAGIATLTTPIQNTALQVPV